MTTHEDSAQTPSSSDFLAAPHGARALAFLIDSAVVALVAGTTAVQGRLWLWALGIFVAYHTALPWMTAQTVGKAVANLEVRRLHGPGFVRTPKGLAWAFGRAGIGYVLVDCLGLGALTALAPRNKGHRCLHDWVFGSVVVMRGPTEWAVPRMRQRLSAFATSRQQASDELEAAQKEGRRISGLWQWLITGTLALDKLLHLVQDVVTRVSTWFGGATPAPTGASALSAKAALAAGVVASTVTVGAVTAVLSLPDAPSDAPVAGRWEGVIVEKTGAHAYVGRAAQDLAASGTTCVWPAGAELMRIFGEGPRFTGQVQWATGSASSCSRFEWRDAEFVFDDGPSSQDPSDDTLGYCPQPRTTSQDCAEFHRE